MRVLLDTHSFLWFINGDPRLSARARQLIEDTDNERFLSVASLWEIAIKMSTGKLQLSRGLPELAEQLSRNSIKMLVITVEHLSTVAALPLHHRDPVDRLLVAQAMGEEMPIISADPVLDAYLVQRPW